MMVLQRFHTYIFAAFGEPNQNHVDKDLGSGANDSVAAVHNYIKQKLSHLVTSEIVIFINGESSYLHRLDTRLLKTFRRFSKHLP